MTPVTVWKQMLLAIGAEISGTDLGYLLHRDPEKIYPFELPFGKAWVFYPQIENDRSKALLLLDVDPVGVARRRISNSHDAAFAQHVNDRPYVVSSLLSVAMSRVFESAMAGHSRERHELADRCLSLEARLPIVPCLAGEDFLCRLFEPLGYAVTARRLPLDELFPEWGASPYFDLTIRASVRLADRLAHLCVLIPVLANDKHYWIGDDEVEKLLRGGEGWLSSHPERDRIICTYRKHDCYLIDHALSQLIADETVAGSWMDVTVPEQMIETSLRLTDQRTDAVMSVLRAKGAKSVLALGYGDGRLLEALLADPIFERIVGIDVSWIAWDGARRHLQYAQLPTTRRNRVRLMLGSPVYRDKRLAGFDAPTLVEVIEHSHPPRLSALERVVFQYAQPMPVVITTPKAECNALFPALPVGQFRHEEHRFEWTRKDFREWVTATAQRYRYSAQFYPAGPEDPTLGMPTQMTVLTR